MKNILNSPLWKSVFVIVFLITMFLVFRFIDNQTIKTLIGMSGFTLLLFSQNREKLSILRKNNIYQILIVLIIVFFTINFIFYKMTNRVLMSGISLGFMTGGVLLLKYNLQRKKENQIRKNGENI
jgi:hypothetical protein